MRTLTLVTLFALALILASGPAAAQTTVTTAPPSPGTGAFDKLSPGNQTIARSIFAAQVKPTSNTGGTTPQPLTLDQIAQRKLDGQGWGSIFHDLKQQNLVTTKNLGQAVSAFHAQQHVKTTGGGTTASGHSLDDGASGAESHGVGHSGSGSSSSFANSGHGNGVGGGASGGASMGHGGGNAVGRMK